MTKKKELNPEIKEVKIDTDKQDLTFLKSSLEQSSSTINIDDDEEKEGSYFKNVVNQLMDYRKPSTKTEYLNVNENFAGAKLQFLAKHGNIPFLDDFISIFEIKRISLERKGRKELIMALVEREKEMQREREEKMRNMLIA